MYQFVFCWIHFFVPKKILLFGLSLVARLNETIWAAILNKCVFQLFKHVKNMALISLATLNVRKAVFIKNSHQNDGQLQDVLFLATSIRLDLKIIHFQAKKKHQISRLIL